MVVCNCSMAGSSYCINTCPSRPNSGDTGNYRYQPPAYPTWPEPRYPWSPNPTPPQPTPVFPIIDYEKLAEEIVKRLKKDGNLHEFV